MAFLGAPAPAAEPPANVVTLQVDPQTVVSPIAPDFMGLGYETSATAQPGYFSAQNHELVRLYRQLSPHGLIRIGGNISDHTRYVPDGPPIVNPEERLTTINQTCLRDLAAFARATGWQVMWGLNLGTGSPAEAVTEARAVTAALGGTLHSFEIGNEVDLQPHFKNYAAYYAAYQQFRTALRTALPQARLSGPDVAGNLHWVLAFAQTEGHDVQLLTHHYYRSGASDPNATLACLLAPDARWADRLDQLHAASQAQGVGYRINEVNSFSGGGKTNVSDTFGAALWCLDCLFVLAAHGCAGVNLETDINQHAWLSHYSPILHDASGHCHACPEYYGLLAFALAGQGDLVKLTLAPGNLNLTAYATKRPEGALWLTIINKDLAQDADVTVTLPAGFASGAAFRLSAPSATSQAQVTLAGAEVSAAGEWSPRLAEPIAIHSSSIHLPVPHASAVVLQLK